MLASVCVIVAALYLAQDVLIPLALAVLFSFLLAPLVKRLERWGFPRSLAVIVVISAATALVGALGYLVYSQVVDLAENLPAYRQNIRTKISRFRPGEGGVLQRVQDVADEMSRLAVEPATQATQPTTQSLVPITEPLKKATTVAVAPAAPATAPAGTESNPLWVVPRDPPQTAVRVLHDTLGRIAPPLGTAGIVVVFVIFMLLTREDMRDRLIRLVGHGQLHVTTQALDDAAKRISRYLLMQLVINGTYGIAIAIGLWVIGVPSPGLWGLLCCVLRFVPYVGPWIAAFFPLALSLASFEGLRQFVYTGLLFVVIELISNNLMEPWLYGSSTGMSTVAVLASAVFWTWLWGPIGLVMATPMTVCLVVLGKYVPQLKFLDILLGDEPVLEPHERVYQRLLALDQEEAEELIEQLIEAKPLQEMYDDVLLPALAIAEQDRHAGRLDEQRSQFVRTAIRQMVDELGDREELRRVRAAADQIVNEAQGKSPESVAREKGTDLDTRLAPLPGDAAVSVVALPAHDEADEIVGVMLAQLLNLRGCRAQAVSHSALASEMLDRVEKGPADIVCISALPPAAVTHARYLCKRLINRFAKTPLLVGLWTVRGDLEPARKRLACSDTIRLSTTLRDALEQIQQLAHSVVTKAGAST